MRRSSVEQYLKAINSLKRGDGRVSTSLIANYLGISQSSVSEFCRKLDSYGYIKWMPYKGAWLTDKGLDIASRVEKRYQAVLNFLILIGVEEGEAMAQACRLEHEISDDSAQKLRHLTGQN